MAVGAHPQCLRRQRARSTLFLGSPSEIPAPRDAEASVAQVDGASPRSSVSLRAGARLRHPRRQRFCARPCAHKCHGDTHFHEAHRKSRNRNPVRARSALRTSATTLELSGATRGANMPESD